MLPHEDAGDTGAATVWLRLSAEPCYVDGAPRRLFFSSAPAPVLPTEPAVGLRTLTSRRFRYCLRHFRVAQTTRLDQARHRVHRLRDTLQDCLACLLASNNEMSKARSSAPDRADRAAKIGQSCRPRQGLRLWSNCAMPT